VNRISEKEIKDEFPNFQNQEFWEKSKFVNDSLILEMNESLESCGRLLRELRNEDTNPRMDDSEIFPKSWH
ncbi:hypothetical protein U1Q18_012856, partial [Sarracenia purpurea var. burkii]